MEKVRKLLDRCAQLLDEAAVPGVQSEKTTALFALDLCGLLFEVLDDSQRHGVVVARKFWSEGVTDGFFAVIDEFANKVDQPKDKKDNRMGAACDRLIWTALNRNTKFDDYSCEYVVLLALEAGISLDAIADILAVYLPGLRSSQCLGGRD